MSRLDDSGPWRFQLKSDDRNPFSFKSFLWTSERPILCLLGFLSVYSIQFISKQTKHKSPSLDSSLL